MLIVISGVLTGLGWYQKLAAKAGAGTLVPITGFANAVVSPAIEFRCEGLVTGVGARMFSIAGPVLVYGLLAIRISIGGDLVADPSVAAVVRLGDTVRFTRPPGLAAWAAVGGKKEADGPLAAGFDLLFTDNRLGEETWEQAESTLQRHCVELLLQKADASAAQIDLALGGDLQSQCTATAYTFRGLDIPFAGGVRSLFHHGGGAGPGGLPDGGRRGRPGPGHDQQPFLRGGAAVPHPAELRGQAHPHRPVDGHRRGGLPGDGPGRAGAGAADGGGVRPGAGFIGKGRHHMGGAMAPAAAETLRRFFADNRCSPADYDGVYTGDLGVVGSEMLAQLLTAEGIDLAGRHKDCGLLLYDRETQQTGAGRKRRGLRGQRAGGPYPARAENRPDAPGAAGLHRGAHEHHHPAAGGKYPRRGPSGGADRAGELIEPIWGE